MGADASIYSMIRPPAVQDPLDQYGRALQLKGMVDQGQLHDIQRKKLMDDMAEEGAYKVSLADWIKAGGKGPLPAEAFAASPSRALAMQEKLTAARAKEGEIAKTDMETLKSRLAVMGGAFGQLAQKQGLTHEDVMQTAKTLAGQGIDPTRLSNILKEMPSDAAELPRFTRTIALMTEHGLKTIEATAPKVSMVDDGKTITPFNTNTLAGPVAPIAGAAPVQKQATPGEVLVNNRSIAQQNQPVWDEQRGVWVNRPSGGAPAAAPAGGTAPAAGAPAGPGVVKPVGLPARTGDVAELRKEFNALPEVKAYRDVLPIVEAARSAPLTASGDIQLGYAVGKILDPNSVVREGEISMVGAAAPVYEKYKGEFDRVVSGTGRFTPETRRQLLAMLDNAVTQRENSYKQAETTYRGVADKQGIPVDQIIITPMKRTGQPDQPAGHAAPQVRRTIGRQSYVKIGDQWYEDRPN